MASVVAAFAVCDGEAKSRQQKKRARVMVATRVLNTFRKICSVQRGNWLVKSRRLSRKKIGAQASGRIFCLEMVTTVTLKRKPGPLRLFATQKLSSACPARFACSEFTNETRRQNL